MPIKVLIVDDEPAGRRGPELILADQSDFLVVATCQNGEEAVTAIREKAPDLVLLDIQMPDMNGFQVIEAVGTEVMPRTIFITAHDQFALDAFEVNALDYVTKPYGPSRLLKALERARKDLAGAVSQGQLLQQLLSTVQGQVAEKQQATRLLVQDGRDWIFVDPLEVIYFEGADYYVQLHLPGRKLLHKETLDNLEQRLDPKHFARIHKSYLVNLNQAKRLRADQRGGFDLVLADGQVLPVSRRRKKQLLDRWKA